MSSSLPDLQKERGFPHPSKKKKLLKSKRESTKSLGKMVWSFYISGEAFSATPPSNASKRDLRFADITGRVTQAIVQFPMFIDGRFSFQIRRSTHTSWFPRALPRRNQQANVGTTSAVHATFRQVAASCGGL
jgi:hypothetical protein